MKRDGSTWSGVALAELLEIRVLMGQMGLRHGNTQEAKRERVCIIFLFLILIESRTIVSIYLLGWRG